MVYCKYRRKIRWVNTGFSLNERTDFVFNKSTFTRRIAVISFTFVIKFVRIFQRYSTLLIKISKYRNRRENCDKNDLGEKALIRFFLRHAFLLRFFLRRSCLRRTFRTRFNRSVNLSSSTEG